MNDSLYALAFGIIDISKLFAKYQGLDGFEPHARVNVECTPFQRQTS